MKWHIEVFNNSGDSIGFVNVKRTGALKLFKSELKALKMCVKLNRRISNGRFVPVIGEEEK